MIKARKLSSAMSAAKAICDHMRDWWFGIAEVILCYCHTEIKVVKSFLEYSCSLLYKHEISMLFHN